MTKKLIALCLVSMLSIVTITSCGSDSADQSATDSSATASVTSASLASSSVIAQGGKQSDSDQQEWINIKSLTITPTQSGATADLNFVLGSARDGMDEASIDYIPPYNIYYLEHPARLVVELQNISFWGYESLLSIPEDSLFYSVFKQPESANNGFCIIFQLSEDVDVSALENGGTLSLNFTKRITQDDQKYYYVMADAKNIFDLGSITQGDLFPTYSNDLNNIVLISKPYKTEDEAKQDLQSLLAQNSTLTDANTFEISLEGNDLPSYGDQSKFAAVYSQNVIQRNGVPETLPVIMPDGLYLASTQDGSLSLFSKQESIPSSDGTRTNYDTLWVLDNNGRVRPLYDIDFSSINKASFSPDGRRVAFIDQSGDDSILYVYDMTTSIFSNLSEEGVGNTTSTFIWDPLGTAIYAISGSNDSQQLLKFDFVVQDESARVTAVEENEIGEGDLGFLNGELYYTNVADEQSEEVIYKIKPEGGLRTEFTTGSGFKIAPNGEYMALIRAIHAQTTVSSSASPAEATHDDDTGETNNSSLILHNIQTNEEMLVEDNAYIVSYDWATDGKLYYAKSISDSFDDKYSFLLRCYDPITQVSVDIAEISPSDFSTTPDPNVIYLNLTDESIENLPIRATYKFTITP